MKTQIAWLFVVAVAFFIGMQFGKRENQTGISMPIVAKKIEIEPREEGQSKAERDDRSNSSTAVPKRPSMAPTARVDVLRDLKKRQVATIRVPVVYNNGKLSDGFAELFALTASETNALEQAIEFAQSEIGRLSLANAKVTQEGKATVVTVQPFEGGADVYDQLMDSFERILGPERYAAMVELHTDELPRVFSGFGAEQRRITITRDSVAENHFRIEDSRRTASGSIGRTTKISDPTELNDVYRWLAPILQQVPHSPSPRERRQ